MPTKRAGGGPYLSERQWGTVREDYSPGGNAWGYCTHDMARSYAYRWGEDGLAGVSDDQQLLCLALGLWNGQDPILKERLFGLSGPEGNHGEDVKEVYYYLDNVPAHSYMRMLYKYPQHAFSYEWLVKENAHRAAISPNSSCSTPPFSTTTATSTWAWNTPKPAPTPPANLMANSPQPLRPAITGRINAFSAPPAGAAARQPGRAGRHRRQWAE